MTAIFGRQEDDTHAFRKKHGVIRKVEELPNELGEKIKIRVCERDYLLRSNAPRRNGVRLRWPS